MEFDELRDERLTLNNEVLQHLPSLNRFRPGELPWFKLVPEEPSGGSDPGTVRHLSTSASCIESMHDLAPQLQNAEQVADLEKLTGDFAEGALRRSDWQSDEAAFVYSRVRTLPIILALAPAEALKGYESAIAEHVSYAWAQLDPREPSAQGIAERARENAEGKKKSKGHTAKSKSIDALGGDRQQYPPNAFHTYWALRLLANYQEKRDVLGLPPLTKIIKNFEIKKAVALLWCNRTLGAQTSLLEGKAVRVDAQQLAWSLLADYENYLYTSDAAGPTRSVAERRELYESGLSAFFAAQDEHSGAWPLYEPLFHYPGAGNAYCYSFETLAELIRPALRPEGYLLRELLADYLPHLVRARKYATRNRIRLGNGAVGWCSGHHPHRREAEGWATASVFSFMEGLRRLIGFWTNDSARNVLGARKTKFADTKSAAEVVSDRGRTWTSSGHRFTVAQQLAGLYLNPMRASTEDPSIIDPDAPLIENSDARSAILYGPPGTGKTTLVEGLAGAIGWDFLEISAAAFVNKGIDQVPARAEEIFTQLMEVDHAVVLFDEVDELIRERGDGTEALGRFLTTSMLPKLAKLWSQRKVIFFVATNSITMADPAIRRSQRFDASIFVAPPSFAKKSQYLDLELGSYSSLPVELEYGAVEKALTDTGGKTGEEFGYFALLRWDQIPELAQRLREEKKSDAFHLGKALGEMGEKLARLEYQGENEGDSALDEWSKLLEETRQDHSRRFLLRVEGLDSEAGIEIAGSDSESDYVEIKSLPTGALSFNPETDECLISLSQQTFKDRGLLDFAPIQTDSVTS
jgi:hypothetical protein